MTNFDFLRPGRSRTEISVLEFVFKLLTSQSFTFISAIKLE